MAIKSVNPADPAMREHKARVEGLTEALLSACGNDALPLAVDTAACVLLNIVAQNPGMEWEVLLSEALKTIKTNVELMAKQHGL